MRITNNPFTNVTPLPTTTSFKVNGVGEDDNVSLAANNARV